MLQQLTVFGESASGLGALGVDGKAFVIQLITFVLAFFVLKKYAFKPILKVLAERRETIESGVRIGEEMQKKQAELDTKVTAALHEARQKADAIIAQAQDAAREAQRESEEKTRLKAENILADAKARGEQDIARMAKDLQAELVGLVSDATEAIIDEKIDPSKDAALIDKAFKNRETGRKTDRQAA